MWVSLQHRRAQILDNPDSQQLREQTVEDLKQILLRFYPGRDWGQLRGEERSERRRAVGLLLGITLILLVLAVTASALAWYANQQRLVAESRALAAQAEQIFVRDQAAAWSLALRSWRTAKTPEANLAVAHAFPQLLTKVEGVQAAFSPDSQRIVTAGADNTARVWNAGTGQLLAKLEGHTNSVDHAAFSPDGQRIVTTSGDNTARMWNVTTGRLLATLRGHTGAVVEAAFSPDSQRVVTAAYDRTPRVERGHRQTAGLATKVKTSASPSTVRLSVFVTTSIS